MIQDFSISLSPSLFPDCPCCHSNAISLKIPRQEWINHKIQAQQDSIHTQITDQDLQFNYILCCASCGTIYIDPMPDQEALNRFYQHYFENNGYYHKKEKKLTLETRKFFILKRLTRGKRFLDLGCNIGCAVEAARRNGFQASGLDPSQDAITIAKEIFPQNNFYTGLIGDFKTDSPFDLIQCSEMIEHAPDPILLIQQIKQHLSPKGILFLTTPEVKMNMEKEEIMNWSEVRPPEHLVLFTKRTLATLLKQHFRTVIAIPHLKRGNQFLAFSKLPD